MGRAGVWMLRIGGAILGLLFLLLLAGFVYEQIGRSRDARRLPPRVGRAVDVGGRTLNLYCSGTGGPTVILETGGNAPGYEWSLLQPKMAEFARTCWYDRAGVGWSDPPRAPRTAASVSRDLHELLRRGGESPPYVLVGASIGGSYARIYAGRYPEDVAGMVLVDPSHPDQREPDYMLAPSNRMSRWARRLFCSSLPAIERFGILRLMTGRTGGGPISERFTADQRDLLIRLETQPKAAEADAEQACAATDGGAVIPDRGSGNPDLDNAARNAGSLGDRPLIVLTAGKYWAPSGLEKVAAAYHEVRVKQLLAGLARLSSRGKQIVVEAGHDMGEDAPEAIVGAVKQVVMDVRGLAQSPSTRIRTE